MKLRMNIAREVTHRIPDHEVLFSFWDDIGAEMFSYWWESHGEAAFIQYLQEHPGEDWFDGEPTDALEEDDE